MIVLHWIADVNVTIFNYVTDHPFITAGIVLGVLAAGWVLERIGK